METFKKIAKKVSQSRKNLHEKFLVMSGTRTRLSAWQTSKNPPKIQAEEATLVWQLVEANYKAYKICHFVGLKKRKVTTIVCVFLRKALTKKAEISKIVRGLKYAGVLLLDLTL